MLGSGDTGDEDSRLYNKHNYLSNVCFRAKLITSLAAGIGQFSTCGRLHVDSKVTLGLFGVLIVLVSVSAAVGVYGLLGVPATLIIIEVRVRVLLTVEGQGCQRKNVPILCSLKL